MGQKQSQDSDSKLSIFMDEIYNSRSAGFPSLSLSHGLKEAFHAIIYMDRVHFYHTVRGLESGDTETFMKKLIDFVLQIG
jgi:hypothetical protein